MMTRPTGLVDSMPVLGVFGWAPERMQSRLLRQDQTQWNGRGGVLLMADESSITSEEQYDRFVTLLARNETALLRSNRAKFKRFSKKANRSVTNSHRRLPFLP